MIFVLAAAAAALAPPTGHYTAPLAKYADSWIAPYFDWPEGAVQAGTYTAVSFELTVNPYGGISDCKVIKVVGNGGMGDLTCKLLRARARFDPARDQSGARLYGIYRNSIVWWLPTDSQRSWHSPENAQYRITVDQLPPGTKEPAVAYIQFAVDQAGQASSCTPEGKEHRELAEIACAHLGPVFKSAPARDRSGRLVDSVQDAKVELVVR
jgi:hypothetical protein